LASATTVLWAVMVGDGMNGWAAEVKRIRQRTSVWWRALAPGAPVTMVNLLRFNRNNARSTRWGHWTSRTDGTQRPRRQRARHPAPHFHDAPSDPDAITTIDNPEPDWIGRKHPDTAVTVEDLAPRPEHFDAL
jgi:hypothetical protein